MPNKQLWYRTQRYPRTLDEAFRTPRYGAAIEIPTTRRKGYGWWAAISVAALVALAVISGR